MNVTFCCILTHFGETHLLPSCQCNVLLLSGSPPVTLTWEKTARPCVNNPTRLLAVLHTSQDGLMDKVDPIVVPHRNSVNGRFRPEWRANVCPLCVRTYCKLVPEIINSNPTSTTLTTPPPQTPYLPSLIPTFINFLIFMIFVLINIYYFRSENQLKSRLL